jgi:hypothetical protein
MSRLMSVAFTEQAVRDRTKTVTRRKGWWLDKNGKRLLVPGDRLTLCRKVMGRRRADGTVEPLVRLAEAEVVDVRREPLLMVGLDGEVQREGFPGMSPAEFMTRFFIEAQSIQPGDIVTRIAWRYLP